MLAAATAAFAKPPTASQSPIRSRFPARAHAYLYGQLARCPALRTGSDSMFNPGPFPVGKGQDRDRSERSHLSGITAQSVQWGLPEPAVPSAMIKKQAGMSRLGTAGPAGPTDHQECASRHQSRLTRTDPFSSSITALTLCRISDHTSLKA